MESGEWRVKRIGKLLRRASGEMDEARFLFAGIAMPLLGSIRNMKNC